MATSTAPSVHYGNHVFAGTISFSGTVNLPDGTVDDDAIASGSSGDYLEASKAEHQFPLVLNQAAGSDVTAETRVVHIARGAATILSVEAVAITAPTGGDKKTTIDVQKSTGGGAFATILTAAFDIDSSSSDLVPETGTLSGTPTLADGDLLAIVVTVSGSTGDQAQGLGVTVFLYEEPT